MRRNRRSLGEPELVKDIQALDDLVKFLSGVERYALDTEFHRERTYWPHVALVQVAWPALGGDPGGVALVDALALDVSGLAVVLSGSATMVAHAAEQDLEVLGRACSAIPQKLWDTQLAAGFTGQGSASLASLASSFLGLDLPKSDRLSDWSARPLSSSQLSYAVSDVAHLFELSEVITKRLDALGRVSWAQDECASLLRKGARIPELSHAWWRLRDSRQLRGRARGVAQEVAAWREQRARALDRPVRHVLPDLAVMAIAHRPPTHPAALGAMRGMEGHRLRPAETDSLFQAIERGSTLEEDRLELPPADDVSRELRPAVALAMAWVGQLARQEAIDASLLATRADVAAFIKGDRDARLRSGWRSRLVGDPLRELLDGKAALAFDGNAGLLIEKRSGRGL